MIINFEFCHKIKTLTYRGNVKIISHTCRINSVSMARKTKEESQRTRDAILDAAEAVFMEKGISAATMMDIADKAGVSRGAVYGHYVNKMDVCIAMCMRVMPYEKIYAEVDVEKSALGQFYNVLYGFLQQFEESGHLRRVMGILHLKCEETEENQPLLDFLWEWRSRGKSLSERLLRLAIVQGEVPKELNVSLAMAFAQSLMSGLCETIFCSGACGDNKVFKDYGRLLRAGLDALRHSSELREENP